MLYYSKTNQILLDVTGCRPWSVLECLIVGDFTIGDRLDFRLSATDRPGPAIGVFEPIKDQKLINDFEDYYKSNLRPLLMCSIYWNNDCIAKLEARISSYYGAMRNDPDDAIDWGSIELEPTLPVEPRYDFKTFRRPFDNLEVEAISGIDAEVYERMNLPERIRDTL